jgi:ribonucleoside-diphosphate reductase alpha chain
VSLSLPESPPGPEPRFDPNALAVLEARYLLRDHDGRLAETPAGLLWRVARTVAAVEARRGADELAVARELHAPLARLEFLPNSPTLMNAGRPRGQLSACFVLPVEDELESIFETVKHAARIHQTGGGTGFSFSRLRPRRARLSSGGEASGPLAFMRVFDAATGAVYQGGVRRGANMGILRVDHPDVLEFIDAKRKSGELTHFNISVAVTDAFMTALDRGTTYELLDPRTRAPVSALDAKMVWRRLVDAAWTTATRASSSSTGSTPRTPRRTSGRSSPRTRACPATPGSSRATARARSTSSWDVPSRRSSTASATPRRRASSPPGRSRSSRS